MKPGLGTREGAISLAEKVQPPKTPPDARGFLVCFKINKRCKQARSPACPAMTWDPSCTGCLLLMLRYTQISIPSPGIQPGAMREEGQASPSASRVCFCGIQEFLLLLSISGTRFSQEHKNSSDVCPKPFSKGKKMPTKSCKLDIAFWKCSMTIWSS